MKTKYLILILLNLFFLLANSQNYKSVVSTDTIYYASKSYFWPYSNTLRTVYITNSVNIGADSVFYFYPTVRPITNTINCLDTLGPSWLGKYFVRNNSGEEQYTNGFNEVILIKTLSNLNDTWKIITDSNNIEIWGTVTQLDTMTIDSQLDTIKTINLQAFLNLTPTAHEYNNRKIILSKNHGFVATLDFFEFPYPFAYTSAINCGDTGTFYRIDRKYTERDLTSIDFFKKFQPGNYWQYVDSFHTNDNTYFFTRLDHVQDSVIASSMLNPDCAIVDFYTITNRNDISFIAPVPPNQVGTYIYHDTVIYTYHTDTVCNPANVVVMRDSIYPETNYNNVVWIYPVVMRYYFNTLADSLAVFSSYFNSYNTYAYDPQFNCVIMFPTVSGESHLYRQYLEGFGIFKKDIFRGNQGGGYIDEDRHFYHYFFKIGNDTFGAPLNLKVLSVNEISTADDISVYPNPSTNGHFFIKTNGNIRWDIFTLDGKLLLSGTKNVIDLSNNNFGIYILKIKMNDTIYYKKLFKNN